MQDKLKDLPEQPICLWRGFRGACPNCGRGRLFHSYLKQNDACAACNADFSKIHADDGPAWLVMIITGAIIVPVAIFLSIHEVMSDWTGLFSLSILAVGAALLLLPRAKGLFIAILWRLADEEAATSSNKN